MKISDRRILDCLKAVYGFDVTVLTLLPLGADANAFVYKAVAHDQLSYFVKIKLGYYNDVGASLLKLLQTSGIQHVIPPLETINGRLNHCDGDFTLIVYPFVEGRDGFSQSLTDEQWQVLGKTLRQIHDADVPLSIQHRIRQEEYSSKWRQMVRSLYAQFNAESISDEIAKKLWASLNEHSVTIHRLVDRAEHLAQVIQRESPKVVLCHSDIHGGNVLMGAHQAIYIVDWDEPIMAPKERDLMFIGGGVGNVWNKPYEEKLFYKGYGETEVNTTILAYYRCERIVEDIAFFGQDLLLTSKGDKDRAEMYKHFLAMFEPRGVVEIALLE